MSPPIYLTVTIDTECDKGPRWLCKRPLSFEGISHGVAEALQPLFRKYRAKPTYLLSSEVIRHAPSRALFAAMSPEEAELGTHLHGEFAESSALVPEATLEFQRDYGPDIERSKLVQLTHDFEQAFGRAPRSFRAGRFGIGEHSLGILQDLGYAVESSVTPGMNWAQAGAPGLEFFGAPTQPYHPDLRAPGRRGDASLWEVPVTIRPAHLRALPWLGKHLEPRWLRPTHMSGPALVRLAEDEIRHARSVAPNTPVVLTCMFHNVEVTPGMSPYAANDGQAQKILRHLEELLAYAKRAGISVVGLADIPALLDRPR